jgi:hypothetical protein
MTEVKNLYIQLPQDLWERIDEARWALRTKTDRETVIRLLEIALENKGKLKPKAP